jgi:CheY-like chemotaxis protein
MRLNYNVLWIDDRKDAIEPIANSIKGFLNEKGFELNVAYHKDGSKLRSMISKPELDLIILDQNLARKTGEELSKNIRRKEKYIEIILYSQDPQTDIKDKSSGLDGIYRTHRDNVEEVIRRVIDRTIKKTQDLNVMRGLVIAETIDIENQVEEIMAKCFKEKGGFFRKKVLDKNVYDFAKKIHFLNSITNDRIKWLENRKSTAMATKLEQLKSLSKEIKKIEEEVLDPRNILAHSVVRYKKAGKAYLRGLNKRTPGINFDHNWCQQMRKTLLKHTKNLNDISQYI